jgi:hypothetical protein
MPVKATLQSSINRTARFGVQHKPSFRLAKIGWIKPRRLQVVGMHLDREIAMRVEELEQEGKLLNGMMPSHQFVPEIADNVAQGCTRHRSGNYDALIVTVVDHLPALRIVIARWQ